MEIIQPKEPKRLVNKEVYNVYPRVTCSCGKLISEPNLNAHQRTNLHKKVYNKKLEFAKLEENGKIKIDMDDVMKRLDLQDLRLQHIMKILEKAEMYENECNN